MKCPHCTVEIHPILSRIFLGEIGGDGNCWFVCHMTCPACSQAIMYLERIARPEGDLISNSLIYPKAAMRPSAPKEVPQNLAEDFNEACLVLPDSAKASAALSRRCLQGVLNDQGFSQKDLSKAIEAVLASKQLPSVLASNVDAVRNIGNFAAHPTKNTSSGAIMPVEPEEAEWNLDVLSELFDFYYVQPVRAAAQREALNAKLVAAGKPRMKE